MDSKPVSILSTKSGIEPKVTIHRWVDKSQKAIDFPKAFSDYNKNMGGVDLHDQYCNSALSIRGGKWTWCLFRFIWLIQASLTNATVLHNVLHPDDRKGIKDVVTEITSYYLDNCMRTRHNPKRRKSGTTSKPTQHTVCLGPQKNCVFVISEDVKCNKFTERFSAKCDMHLCSIHMQSHKQNQCIL